MFWRVMEHRPSPCPCSARWALIAGSPNTWITTPPREKCAITPVAAWQGDGHTGVDIAIRDGKAMAAGVTVVAAASGRVGRVREGVSDQDARTTGGDSAAKDQSCGNGVLVDHGGGWQSLYCHLRRGSIVVRPGQTVKTDDPLGRVGLSGETEYPRLL